MSDYTPTLRFLSDPGHGWLRAPIRLLSQYGIADKISEFSYLSREGDYVYLEEDCDAPCLIQAMRTAGVEPKIVNAASSNSDSYVRRLPRYRP